MIETVAILVAAGRGERLGASLPKAFVPLGGEPLLLHAARAFEEASSVAGLVAVVPPDRVPEARRLLQPLGKLRAVGAGGERRQDSVRAGLRLLPGEFEGVVLVHDAARPLVEPVLIDVVAQAAALAGAAVPVLSLTDTVKRLAEARVAATIDRRELASAQTPQGFRYPLLMRAYEEAYRAGAELTDEAMAVERLGEPVQAVAGSSRNRKITGPDDLAWAEWQLAGGGPGGYRTGNGFDVHRLVAGRPLMLGGVRVEHDRGLEGHSDGDCVIHAVCDALLGAMAAGDMGRYFPSSDARWENAPSLRFLEEVAGMVAARGQTVASLDVTVVAERPALAPHVEAMRAVLCRALGVPLSAVSVKAKSADGLGALGAGEGIAALATALLRGASTTRAT